MPVAGRSVTNLRALYAVSYSWKWFAASSPQDKQNHITRVLVLDIHVLCAKELLEGKADINAIIIIVVVGPLSSYKHVNKYGIDN
jgi:hypothetical protein